MIISLACWPKFHIPLPPGKGEIIFLYVGEEMKNETRT